MFCVVASFAKPSLPSPERYHQIRLPMQASLHPLMNRNHLTDGKTSVG